MRPLLMKDGVVHSDFDKILDDEIGYLNYDSADYSASLQGFAPGIGDTLVSDNRGFAPIGSNVVRSCSAATGLPIISSRLEVLFPICKVLLTCYIARWKGL